MVVGVISKNEEIMKTAGADILNIAYQNSAECIFCENNFKPNDSAKSETETDFFRKSDAVIVLGGDGTLIQLAVKAAQHDVPILGINYGRIGLLSDMEKDELHMLNSLFKNEYVIDERMMLKASVVNNNEVIKEFTALNDIVISRGISPKMLEVNLYIDNDLASDIRADGIIAATPTGSTAYSLSAGGSVIDPAARLIAFTPICPHTLNSRPLIMSEKRKLILKHTDKEGISCLSCDGQDIFSFERKYDVHISADTRTVKLIRIKNRNFYSILREKL